MDGVVGDGEDTDGVGKLNVVSITTMDAPKVDKHRENWCGYFKNEEEAQKHFDHELQHLSINNLIVSAKKEYTGTKSLGLLLFKFMVVTADKP